MALGPRSCSGLCRIEIEELPQRIEANRPFRAGGELLGPYRRLVQDLAQDPVDGGRQLGLLLFAEVRELVAQPGQLGVRELPDVRAHGWRARPGRPPRWR